MTSHRHFTIRALGGLGEIGMNSFVLETEGRLLVVDCGVMFAAGDSGIDLIHPDFRYLMHRRDDIEAVVLTHAHEDHLSGVPFLLREADLAVYGGSYSIELLKLKASEPGRGVVPMTRMLSAGSAVTLGPFSIKTFPMPHSIVQNTGLVVDMKAGRLLHTGDFKLGVNSADSGRAVLGTLKGAGGGRVDLILSDSTGAEETEPVGEESEVYDTFDQLFGRAVGRIFVAIFSSNIRRLGSVLELAQKHGRKVGLAGRSVLSHIQIASATSEITVPSGLIQPLSEMATLPRHRVVVIVSGTQGEPRSALARLAAGTHHLLKVDPDDQVILSSRFIPGNELIISQMIDRLLTRGAEVYHRNNTQKIHVSGHGGRAEISAAIRAVGPRCFLPVHGTVRHLRAGAALAEEAGVKHVAVASNGQVVHCSDVGLSVEDDGLPAGRVYIDLGGELTSQMLRDRRILSASGVVSVSFAVDDLGDVLSQIQVVSRGLVPEASERWFSDFVEKKIKSVAAHLAKEETLSLHTLRDAVRQGVRKCVLKKLNRDPLVLVSIVTV